jgi:Flp pilus assembly protein TadG
MRDTGQALVEFALAISVFMLLVLGTFDLARAYLDYTVITNAAREAGRYGAAHFGEPGPPRWDVAANQAGVSMEIGLDAPLNLTVGQTTIGTLTYVTVTGTYQFHSITPMVGALLGDPIPMRADTATLVG